MNRKLLKQKMDMLQSHQHVEETDIQQFMEIISRLEDWSLRRINPILFAKIHGLDKDKTIDTFIRSARFGIFDLSWNLICPSCGGTLNKNNSLDDIADAEKFKHCVICNVDVPYHLDDYVEVSFTINPDIYQIRVDSCKDFQNYRRYHFSENIQTNVNLLEYITSVFRGYYFLNPQEKKEILFENWTEKNFRMVSASIHANKVIPVNQYQKDKSQKIDALITSDGFILSRQELNQGKIIVRVENQTGEKVGFTFFATDFDILHKIMKEFPNQVMPFLTGKMLLNNHVFRELFKIQNLKTTLKLDVRSLTILFTDLKGSTELYSQIGDVDAYSLIQEHFKILSGSVHKFSGAIIKTMGDAIMATFSQPEDGISAAIDMMKNIKSIQSTGGHELGLKIGLHEGPALAINNAGMLDYFGQTINIGARVQGLAKEDEIWLSDSIFKFKQVQKILEKNQYSFKEHSSSLKGIGEKTTVHQCTKC